MSFYSACWRPPPSWVAGSISFSDAKFLCDLLHRERPSVVLEIGTASGFSAATICQCLDYAARALKGDSEYRVISYDLLEHFYADPSKKVGEAAREMLDAALIKHVEFRNPRTAADAVRDFAPDSLSFCFIDANHRHPWPALDLLAVTEIIRPGGIVVLHDINMPSLPWAAANPALVTRGVESLFNDLALEKEVAMDSLGIPNIGSVRIPHDKHRLRRQLVDIIHGHPWELEVAADYLARLSVQGSGGLTARLRRPWRRFRLKRNPLLKAYTLLAAIRSRLDAGEDPDALQRELNEISRKSGGLGDSHASNLARLQARLSTARGWKMIGAGDWAHALAITDQFGHEGENDELLIMRGRALNGLGRHRDAEAALRRVSGCGAQAHAAVDLACAVSHQERHGHAEGILLDSLTLTDKHPDYP